MNDSRDSSIQQVLSPLFTKFLLLLFQLVACYGYFLVLSSFPAGLDGIFAIGQEVYVLFVESQK
jgi:hypothetical protein